MKEIHLIRGNHDPKAKYDDILREIFTTVTDINEFKYNKRKFFLCHYPLITWKNSQHGSINLHGHCHGSLPKDPYAKRMDVGIDCHPEFMPFHIDEIIEELKNIIFQPVDHHGMNKNIT